MRPGGGVPTWSWMSRICHPLEYASTCAIKYKHVAKHEFQADRRLAIDDAGTFCNYEQGNPFGRPLGGGQITLSAASCWATVRTASAKRLDKQSWNGRNTLQLSIDSDGGTTVAQIPFAADCPGEDPQTVRLLQRVLCVLFGGRKAEPGEVAPQCFLALAPVSVEDGNYQRIGFCETDDWVELFDAAEVRVVRVV